MELFTTIVTLVISLLGLLIPVGILAGIILAIVMANQPDPVKKGKIKYWMIRSFFVPVLLLVVVVVIWGLIAVATGAGK